MVTLHEKDNGTSVDMNVNACVRIELTGTPTTGYWWYFQDLDQEFVELIKEDTRDMSPPGIEGGRILGIWLLRTKRVGSTFLKMAYYRPWEGGEKAIRAFSVELRIAS